MLIKRIDELRKAGHDVQIISIFSELIPCRAPSNCAQKLADWFQLMGLKEQPLIKYLNDPWRFLEPIIVSRK
jgi:hypothetical protein